MLKRINTRKNSSSINLVTEPLDNKVYKVRKIEKAVEVAIQTDKPSQQDETKALLEILRKKVSEIERRSKSEMENGKDDL
jgi:hypothetical protein